MLGFEPRFLRPQRRVLTTRRHRHVTTPIKRDPYVDTQSILRAVNHIHTLAQIVEALGLSTLGNIKGKTDERCIMRGKIRWRA